jgi:hypothetical protein
MVTYSQTAAFDLSQADFAQRWCSWRCAVLAHVSKGGACNICAITMHCIMSPWAVWAQRLLLLLLLLQGSWQEWPHHQPELDPTSLQALHGLASKIGAPGGVLAAHRATTIANASQQ